jgi:hypothetical protein
VLLHESRPLRLHDLIADERGRLPSIPPADAHLPGVPISLRGGLWNSLTEKADGLDFTAEDETALACRPIAIENVRLYESAREWSSRLESLNEVGNALATETASTGCST